MPPSPESVACRHEAGHAVAAHLLGAEIRHVTIETELDDHAGATEVAWPASVTEDERTALSARVALAGPLAELAFLGRDVLEDPDVLQAWGRDWGEVSDAAARLAGGDAAARDRLVKGWITDVRTLFDDPAVDECVARVADALEAHESLDPTLFEDCLG